MPSVRESDEESVRGRTSLLVSSHAVASRTVLVPSTIPVHVASELPSIVRPWDSDCTVVCLTTTCSIFVEGVVP